MNRPRLLDFRTSIANLAQSVGSPLGVCVGDTPALAGLVNLATQNWLFDPLQPDAGWWFCWQRMRFSISQNSPYITSPYQFARVIVMDVPNRPTKIQNGFYEFLDYGIGLQPKTCPTTTCDGPMMAYDRETTATLGTLNSTPQNIRVYPTDSRDVGKTVIIQGADQNGQTVLGTDPATNQPILGEILTLDLPFVTSLNQFSGGFLTGLQKDSTFGPVTFHQVDPSTGNESDLSSMEATETSAAYRRYYINNLPCNTCYSPGGITQVTAMCKLDYVPVASDPDYLIIPNVPALIAECEAIRYRGMDNLKAQALADKRHNEGAQLLFGQLDHYMGRERPAINVSLFGPRRSLKYQPI